MAMSGNGLRDEILTRIRGLSDEDKGNMEKVWEAIAHAIVDYLKNNMEVQLSDILLDAISSATVTPQDGGATLKTSLKTFLQNNPNRSKVR